VVRLSPDAFDILRRLVQRRPVCVLDAQNGQSQRVRSIERPFAVVLFGSPDIQDSPLLAHLVTATATASVDELSKSVRLPPLDTPETREEGVADWWGSYPPPNWMLPAPMEFCRATIPWPKTVAQAERVRQLLALSRVFAALRSTEGAGQAPRNTPVE